jgi:PAS domain S-box-containing protein
VSSTTKTREELQSDLEALRARLAEVERLEARGAESDLQRLFDLSPDMLCVADIDGYFRRVNPAFTSTLGYSAEELLGRPFLDFVNPEDREPTSALIEEKLSQGVPVVSFENRYRSKDGSYRWFSWTSCPVPDEGITYAVARDITERKRIEEELRSHRDRLEQLVSERTRQLEQEMLERKKAEETLRESEGRLRLIADTIEDAFWITDWSDHRPVFVSPAYEKIWGRTAESLYRNPTDWADAIHPDDRQRAWENFAGMQEGERYDEEYRVVRPDGSIRWIRDRGFAVRDEKGQVDRVVGIAQDITERKRADEEREKLAAQLRHAQKMEAVGQLAGGVAHDFNNLLTAILGNADLLLPMMEPGLDESSSAMAKHGLQRIKLAGHRAAAVTRQLLAFSRKEMTRAELLDLDQVIRDAEEMLRRLLREDIVFDVRSAPGTRRIRADAGQIEQVIMNLVLNACDAMPEGGTLTVASVDVDADEGHAAAHAGSKRGPHVMLAVSDTGVGMSPETMDRMFEPFFTTKPTGKGTGLGLATVYGIVGQTGAHIAVDSELGKGSMFRVYFPAVEDEAGKREAVASVEESRGDEVILVCEDDESVREVACQALRAAGYTVLEAENGRRGLDESANHDGKIDLLISDVIMPEMSGKELAEAMLRHHPEIRVLFASGYADDVLDGQISQSEGKDFLQKPFGAPALLQRVREVLDQTQPRFQKDLTAD